MRRYGTDVAKVGDGTGRSGSTTYGARRDP